MSIVVKITDNRIKAKIPIGPRTSLLLSELEGRSVFDKFGFLGAAVSGNNIEAFKKHFPDAEIDDQRTRTVNDRNHEAVERRPYLPKDSPAPYQHQLKGLELGKDKTAFAYYMDQGTGKSRVAIDRTGDLWCKGEIHACIVVSLANVYPQWGYSEIPEWLWQGVPRTISIWPMKELPPNCTSRDKLNFFCLNVDAITERRKKAKLDKDGNFVRQGNLARALLEEFIKAHDGRVHIIMDESHTIKNHSSSRSQAWQEIASLCSHRTIMTGTPQLNDISDIWGQFKFLDEDIIGYKFVTSFRNEFFNLGKYDKAIKRQPVLGIRNLEKFQALIDPYVYRVTKEECLDLPDKIYHKHRFNMTSEQREMYEELRENYILELEEGGEAVAVKNGAGMILRLQQISCGFLPYQDGSIKFFENPRLTALNECRSRIEGKAIIWARFRPDIESIVKDFERQGRKVLTITGDGSSSEARMDTIKRFMDRDSGYDDLIANQQAGGTGLNLQGVCEDAIYYSNSFRASDRWQSEDRIHRIGTKGDCNYWDLICRGSIDAHILLNLKKKKDSSQLVLGDLLRMLKKEINDDEI